MDYVVAHLPGGDAAGEKQLTDLVRTVWSVPAQAPVRLRRGRRGNPTAVILAADSGNSAGVGQAANAQAGFGTVAEVECSRSRSHSWHAAACLAPGETGWLGIDVEDSARFSENTADPLAFAELTLHPAEREWFAAYAAGTRSAQLHALLRAWVRKEAVAKSLHLGFANTTLGLAPDEIAVTDPALGQAECLSHPWIAVYDCETLHGSAASLAYNPSGQSA